MTIKTQEPSSAVPLFRLNPQTGAVEYTVEGLRLFKALRDDLADHDARLEALEP